MAHRKNTKRVDPKYFLEETALRDEVVNEGGDAFLLDGPGERCCA